MSRIAESELIINSRGAIYHLDCRPEEIATTIITVGDPDRVKEVSKYFDKIALARELHLAVLKRFAQLEDGVFAPMLKEYNQLLFCLGKTVKLKKGNVVFDTTIKGVTAHGQLITMDAIERKFDFGEVAWVL